MYKKVHEYASVLGVGISSIRKQEVLKLASISLKSHGRLVIVTPNPEIVLAAQKNNDLRSALNAADIAIPDGVGLALGARLLTGKRLEVLKGRELMLDLLELAKKEHAKVYFLGSTSAVIKQSLKRASAEYSGARFKGSPGPQLTREGKAASDTDKHVEREVLRELAAFKPNMLFVAFGAPKQELWVQGHQAYLGAKITMVVGGSLDYYAGVKPLPPGWMAHAGFEWLWRLMCEPGHIKRVFNALVVFPLTVLKEKCTPRV